MLAGDSSGCWLSILFPSEQQSKQSQSQQCPHPNLQLFTLAKALLVSILFTGHRSLTECIIILARSQRGSLLSHSARTLFPQISCSFTGSHACCPPRNDDLGVKGGSPPHFLLAKSYFVLLLRKACKNSKS